MRELRGHVVLLGSLLRDVRVTDGVHAADVRAASELPVIDCWS